MNSLSDENAQRLIKIFDQAKLQSAGEQRERFLVEACGAGSRWIMGGDDCDYRDRH